MSRWWWASGRTYGGIVGGRLDVLEGGEYVAPQDTLRGQVYTSRETLAWQAGPQVSHLLLAAPQCLSELGAVQ